MKQRKDYLEKIIQTKDNDFVKVITGVRRSGKSFLLKMYADYLKKQKISEDHIIEINYEK